MKVNIKTNSCNLSFELELEKASNDYRIVVHKTPVALDAFFI